MSNPGGKGDKRRPKRITEQQMNDRWAAIFGTTKPKRSDDEHRRGEGKR